MVGGRGGCEGGLNESGGASEQPVGGDLPIKRRSALGSLICHLCCDARQEILQGHNRRRHPSSSSSGGGSGGSSAAPLHTHTAECAEVVAATEGRGLFLDGWMVSSKKIKFSLSLFLSHKHAHIEPHTHTHRENVTIGSQIIPSIQTGNRHSQT